MRIERHGGPPDLQAAFTKCALTELKGRVLDDDRNVEAALGRFPDFTCFRDLVLIEMKHLQTNQSDRINEVFDKTVDPADKPIFYGTRDGQHIINQASNGDEVKAALVSKLSRTVETHLSKANSQFADYRSRHPRKNSVSICVILNSQLREFTPDLVLHAVQGKMRGLSGDTPRNEDTAVQMRLFTHIIEETNRRGLDLRKVNPAILSPAEQEQVYRGLPQELIDLLLPNPPTPGRAAETE